MNIFKAMTRHDLLLLTLIALYSYLFIAGHDFVSKVYANLIVGLDRSSVESALFWGAMMLVTVGVGWLGVRNRKNWLFWGEGALLGFMLWLSSVLLICTNVESVHYPQYAILGFLVRSLIDRDLLALLACNLVSMVDEFIQYVMNPHYTKYLDFNDMILNLVGVMLGISLWHWLWTGRPNSVLVSYCRRAFVFCYAMLAIAIVWVVIEGRVISYWKTSEPPHTSLQLVGEKMAFVLSYVDISATFQTTGLGREYHILNVLEWSGASLILFGLAWGLSRFRKNEKGNC